MDYKIKKDKKNMLFDKSEVILIKTELLEYIYDLLRGVDMTGVWSPKDNQYIKVSDIDETVVEEIEFMLKINKLK